MTLMNYIYNSVDSVGIEGKPEDPIDTDLKSTNAQTQTQIAKTLVLAHTRR